MPLRKQAALFVPGMCLGENRTESLVNPCQSRQAVLLNTQQLSCLTARMMKLEVALIDERSKVLGSSSTVCTPSVLSRLSLFRDWSLSIPNQLTSDVTLFSSSFSVRPQQRQFLAALTHLYKTIDSARRDSFVLSKADGACCIKTRSIRNEWTIQPSPISE